MYSQFMMHGQKNIKLSEPRLFRDEAACEVWHANRICVHPV